MNRAPTSKTTGDSKATEPWHVRLYVAGWTPSSLAATLIRLRPEPLRHIVGNLNDITKALAILGFETA